MLDMVPLRSARDFGLTKKYFVSVTSVSIHWNNGPTSNAFDEYDSCG